MIKQLEFGMLIDYNKLMNFPIHQMILAFVYLEIQVVCSLLQDSSQELFESLILKTYLLPRRSNIIVIPSSMLNIALMEDSLPF